MKAGGGSFADDLRQRLIRLDVVAGVKLLREIRDHGRGAHDTTADLQPLQQHRPVMRVDEIVRLNLRLGERVGGAGADMALAFGALLPGGEGHARLVVKLVLPPFLVACGHEGELQVRRLQRRV